MLRDSFKENQKCSQLKKKSLKKTCLTNKNLLCIKEMPNK